jgi:hypothetical protein
MWRTHRRYALMALTFGFALSTGFWTETAAPATRSAPTTPPPPAPTEAERALGLFKAKAEQFQRFLSQSPVFLSKQDFSKSPTGVIYYHLRVKLLESGFDVQRSDSLVSPFIGYLYLTYDAEETTSCGDMIVTYPGGSRESYGYTTYEKAMAHPPDCFRRWRRSPPSGDNVRLSFAYQDGRWILKDALRPKYNNQDGPLLAALGQANPPHHRVPDNQAWEALIK